MNLFINTISAESCIILFNNNREILKKTSFEIKWNESSLLIPILNSFLKNNNLTYNSIENIVVVNWPWSFTWIRSTILAVNAINYIIWKYITPISFFDLFDSFPIIKSSSKKDSFIKFKNISNIEIINNIEIENTLQKMEIKKIYWNWNVENIEIVEKIDYSNIIKKITLEKNIKVEALYIKKPNIC